MPHASMRRISAFTLVEILVALFIFAIVGLIGTQLISRVAQQQTILSERGARLIELQRAMLVLKRDLMQAQSRPIRDGLGDSRPALLLDGDNLLEFTRAGWRNPLRQPRSDLQRVAYVLDEDSKELQRYYWPELDRAQDTDPVIQTLLTHVERVAFTAIDKSGNVHDFWPTGTASGQGTQPGRPALPGQGVQPGQGTTTQLVAVAMRLDTPPFGTLERIWEIPGA